MLHEPGQTTTTSCNVHKCRMKNFTSFKFEQTTPNMSQHLETCHNRVAKRTQHVAPDNVAIGCVEILLSFSCGLTCVIIYMKKLLDSDWLRAVQFKCNTPVQKV